MLGKQHTHLAAPLLVTGAGSRAVAAVQRGRRHLQGRLQRLLLRGLRGVQGCAQQMLLLVLFACADCCEIWVPSPEATFVGQLRTSTKQTRVHTMIELHDLTLLCWVRHRIAG